MCLTNRSRQTLNMRWERLANVLPNGVPCSFGAFAGEASQRSAVLLRGASSAVGRMGVVLVHNDLRLESALVDLCAQLHVPTARVGLTVTGRTSVVPYDVLYGLDRTGVLRAMDTDNDASSSAHIGYYLSILDMLYALGAKNLGAHAYNLAMLLRLASMSITELETMVLQPYRDNLSESLYRAITSPGVQQDTYKHCLTLAQQLGGMLGQTMDRLSSLPIPSTSLYAACAAREAISVYLPSPDSTTLNYLDVELDCLVRHGIPHMILVSGICVRETSLLERIIGERGSSSYLVGVASDNPLTLTGNQENLASLFARLDRGVVFPCANSQVAQSISDVFGSYERVIKERSTSAARSFGQLFATKTTGQSERILNEPNVRPESLVMLGRGALVFGRGIKVPLLVSNFDSWS